MTTKEIKESRVQYAKEIIQPFREGVVSKEYLEAYGDKGIKATKQEIKNAKYVWHGIEGNYYKKHD